MAQGWPGLMCLPWCYCFLILNRVTLSVTSSHKSVILFHYISARLTTKLIPCFLSPLPGSTIRISIQNQVGTHLPYSPTIVGSLVPSPDSLFLPTCTVLPRAALPTTYQPGLSDLHDFPFFIRIKGLSYYNIKTQQYSGSRTTKFLSIWQSRVNRWAFWLHSVISGLGFIPSHHVSPLCARVTVSSAQL